MNAHRRKDMVIVSRDTLDGARRARCALDDDGSPTAAEVARHRPAVSRNTKRPQGTARRLPLRTVPMEIILTVSDDLYDLDLPPDFGRERDRHNPRAADNPLATPRSTSAP